MYCEHCGSKIDMTDKFCANCGGKNSNVQLVNNVVDKKGQGKVVKFTLLRSLIQFVVNLLVVISFFLVIYVSEKFNSDVWASLFLGFLIVFVALYLYLAIILNKSVKLQKFSDYLLGNIFSLCLYFGSSIFAFLICFEIVELFGTFYAEAGAFLLIFLIVYNFFAIGFMFIVNIIIDCFSLKKR